MTVAEIAMLTGVVVGPIAAVLITLWHQGRKQTRDRQIATFRMLVSTRHLPSDPAYSTAINMVPVDFNKVRSVMLAHKNYIETITYAPTPENMAAHEEQIIAKQTKLIFEMSKCLGYALPETDIQTTAYAAGGFIQRDNLMLRAWEAWPRIADALESQSDEISDEKVEPKRKGRKS